MDPGARLLQRATSIAVGIALVIGLGAAPALAIEPVQTSIDMTKSGTPLGGVPFWATVVLSQVDPPGPATGATGDVTVSEGATVLDTCTLASGTCDVTLALATGDHTLTVSYPGDAAFLASSKDVTWTVIADTVDATGVGLSRTTFYPYRDGYRDTVTARGTRNESISVTIKVFSPANKLLKRVDLASAKGAYAWAWNGRNASGTMYPAGRYKITQKLTDDFDTTRTWTSYVTLSAKRLYTYTKTLTQTYSQRKYQNANGVIWVFTLPSATLYKKLVFKTYAKSGPGGSFGPQDYTICSGLDGDCVAPWAKIGNSFAWRSVTGSVSNNRSGRTVRLYAWSTTRSNLKYGRVVVTYAILK